MVQSERGWVSQAVFCMIVGRRWHLSRPLFPSAQYGDKEIIGCWKDSMSWCFVVLYMCQGLFIPNNQPESFKSLSSFSPYGSSCIYLIFSQIKMRNRLPGKSLASYDCHQHGWLMATLWVPGTQLRDLSFPLISLLGMISHRGLKRSDTFSILWREIFNFHG